MQVQVDPCVAMKQKSQGGCGAVSVAWGGLPHCCTSSTKQAFLFLIGKYGVVLSTLRDLIGKQSKPIEGDQGVMLMQ